ncbi:MAG: LysM peptidoglycan-binding domain-containing protein [Eubacterium sp.]
MTVLKKKILLTVSFVMLLAMAVFTSVRLVNVDAMSSENEPLYKYYTSYEIQPGDTLTSIAEKYTVNTQQSVPEYVEEIRENNNLNTDNIVSGKKIIIAYYSDEYK